MYLTYLIDKKISVISTKQSSVAYQSVYIQKGRSQDGEL